METLISSSNIVGIFGFFLVINSILLAFSLKYYSFLSRAFFIEPVSEDERRRAEEFINKSKNSEQYGISVILGGLGIIAIIWSVGKIQSITLPFVILVILTLVSRFFIKK